MDMVDHYIIIMAELVTPMREKGGSEKMSKTCDKCGKKFKNGDTVYWIQVVEGEYPDSQTGRIGAELNICNDCFFVSDFSFRRAR